MRLEDARVLIVDDEEALRGIFAKWLAKAGCRSVRTASDGQQAVESIRQEPIDVLITDVLMPVMDGVSLVRKLTELGQRIPTIIFVSGFGDVDRREMYDLGVESFLAKPFHLEELAAAVHHAIVDRALLWCAPMELAPRQGIHLQLPGIGIAVTPPAGVQPHPPNRGCCFGLGRGGFSVRAEEPLGFGKISFECRFPAYPQLGEGAPCLRGQGHVRWRSHSDRTVGIEFAYLESPGREWVIDRIAQSKPRSYIPALQPALDSG